MAFVNDASNTTDTTKCFLFASETADLQKAANATTHVIKENNVDAIAAEDMMKKLSEGVVCKTSLKICEGAILNYATLHAALGRPAVSLTQFGYSYKPEAVSTDYNEKNWPYFENNTLECVVDIYQLEASSDVILLMPAHYQQPCFDSCRPGSRDP